MGNIIIAQVDSVDNGGINCPQCSAYDAVVTCTVYLESGAMDVCADCAQYLADGVDGDVTVEVAVAQ